MNVLLRRLRPLRHPNAAFPPGLNERLNERVHAPIRQVRRVRTVFLQRIVPAGIVPVRDDDNHGRGPEWKVVTKPPVKFATLSKTRSPEEARKARTKGGYCRLSRDGRIG